MIGTEVLCHTRAVQRRTLAAALLFTPVTRTPRAQPTPADAASQDAKAPPLERLDGTRFDPREAEGRVLVLYWWASWCPFCALVSPHIDARDYLARRGYTFPAAWVTPEFQRAVPKPRGLPVTVVRGRDGRVRQAEAGQLFPEDVMALARHLQ